MKTRQALFSLIILSLLITACGLRASNLQGGFSDPGIGIGEAPPQAPMEREFVGAEEAMSADSAAESVLQTNGNLTPERLVIRNANMTVVVRDPAESVDDIARMAQAMGGYVVSSNTFQQTYGDATLSEPLVATHASITIRVPSENLDEALEMIEEGAEEVRNRNVTGQDVTEEFTDLESRLRNLEAAEEQLREILDDAVETEDVLQVFEELRRVREQIEVIRGRMQFLEESARLSAISVELIPDVAAQPLQLGSWTPTGTAKEAVEALIRTLRFLVDMGIWAVICVLPIGLLLGLPGYFVGRSVMRRRREAAAAESKDEQKK